METMKKYEGIAAKVHHRFPHLKNAYDKGKEKGDLSYWAWACIYCTTACEVLSLAEVQDVIRLSEGYAGGRPAYE